MNERQEIIDKITGFIREIGIGLETATLSETETFVPGIRIDKGKLLYDPENMKYPGDLLHEAGHIAVMPEAERHLFSGDVKADAEDDIMGDEIAAILWSYAASSAIGLPLEVVFHPNGYRGASQWYVENFQNKTYMGLPLLVWMGLTYDTSSADPQKPPFPHMSRWLRA